jgi:hypothetical protein
MKLCRERSNNYGRTWTRHLPSSGDLDSGCCASIVRNRGNELVRNTTSNFRAVDDFVAAKASDFNESQQLSTSGMQQVQYQSLKNNSFQQSSTGLGIWFGTRGATRLPSCKPFRFNKKKSAGVESCRSVMFLQLQNRLQCPPSASRAIAQAIQFETLVG